MVIHTAPQVGFGGGNTAKTDEASVAVRRKVAATLADGTEL